MNAKQLVALSLLVTAGAATAGQEAFTVEVRADANGKPSLLFQCASPAQPTRQDVEAILDIKDSTQTAALRGKLMAAVGEACDAGIARIQVTRGANGASLSWEAAEG